MNKDVLSEAATIARGLAIDAVAACKSGHLGLPLGAAEVGAVLFGDSLSMNPRNPDWINRDRFVLSAGHGSMFLYAWLHLSGFDVSLDDIKNFRVLHSKTPGHPEFGETPGVESTTGPLGQGVGNSVGMAVAAKMTAEKFNTADHTIIDHHIVCLAGDGCLQEGITAEASAFAGHFGLDNLILIFDSNDVTLDAAAEETQSEDTAKRYEAYGWDVVTIDGYDMDGIQNALANAKSNDNGKPKLIIARTLIGKGIKQVAGTAAAHGESGMKFAAESRAALGLPEENFYVSENVKSYFAERKQNLAQKYNDWLDTYHAWKSANPELAGLLESAQNDEPVDVDALFAAIPEADSEQSVATRVAGGNVINALAKKLPLLLTGSADLFGSTKNYINGVGDFTRDNPSGRNIRFGIREHAMGAIVNGIAYHGIFTASGATFTIFADYMRPALRLAALSKLHNFQIFTHDSVAVGQDGPTHQPVEVVSALRLIPGMDVIRPADPEETAGAFVAALERQDGPTSLVLSRQGVPTLNNLSVEDRRKGVLKGGYIARKEIGDLAMIILSNGSELQHALDAAEELGVGTRVVSMPCFERFDRQSDEYRETILPSSCRKRVAIEAGVNHVWFKYVGLDGKVVGIDRFGLSAEGGLVLRELGITKESVIAAAQSL
ncbi:MAG: transketolase [Verrucomicrobia bacterium]|nr:transketolase [Verrucomicrobiota bacterium]